jgi:hypothetical protein
MNLFTLVFVVLLGLREVRKDKGICYSFTTVPNLTNLIQRTDGHILDIIVECQTVWIQWYWLFNISVCVCIHGGTWWHSWLSHCAASSIPDGVIGILHCLNRSNHNMARGSTQPLSEMSTRSISWGKRWPVLRAGNLAIIMHQFSQNLETSTSWNPQVSSGVDLPLRYVVGSK